MSYAKLAWVDTLLLRGSFPLKLGARSVHQKVNLNSSLPPEELTTSGCELLLDRVGRNTYQPQYQRQKCSCIHNWRVVLWNTEASHALYICRRFWRQTGCTVGLKRTRARQPTNSAEFHFSQTNSLALKGWRAWLAKVDSKNLDSRIQWHPTTCNNGTAIYTI